MPPHSLSDEDILVTRLHGIGTPGYASDTDGTDGGDTDGTDGSDADGTDGTGDADATDPKGDS